MEFNFNCLRCGHKWKSRKKEPKECPNCKQYTYNKPRVFIRNERQIASIKQDDVQEVKQEDVQEVKKEKEKRSIDWY